MRSEAALERVSESPRMKALTELLTCAIKALGDGVKKGVLRGQEPFHHWHDDYFRAPSHPEQRARESREVRRFCVKFKRCWWCLIQGVNGFLLRTVSVELKAFCSSFTPIFSVSALKSMWPLR